MITIRFFGLNRTGGMAIGLLLTLSSQVCGQELAVRPDGIAMVRLCEPLAELMNLKFAAVRDTTLWSAGVNWPGKIVVLASGEELLVEASPVDHERISRVSTDSPAARTAAGYGVGSTLGALIGAGEELEVHLPEGHVIVLVRTAGIAVSVEDRFARVIWDEWSPGRPVEEYLPRAAKVSQIHVGSSCPR